MFLISQKVFLGTKSTYFIKNGKKKLKVTSLKNNQKHI